MTAICRTSAAASVLLFDRPLCRQNSSVTSAMTSLCGTCLVAIAPTIFFDRLGLDSLQKQTVWRTFLLFCLFSDGCVSHVCYLFPQKKSTGDETSNPKKTRLPNSLAAVFQDLCLGLSLGGGVGFSMWSICRSSKIKTCWKQEQKQQRLDFKNGFMFVWFW